MFTLKFHASIRSLAVASAMTMTAAAGAADTPAVTPAPYSDAPVDIREFLLKAKAADKILDPLARCLAFPDLPDNHWPAGLAKAHCQFAFGAHPTLLQIKDYLDRGATAELEALYASFLESHFSKDKFSEDIHAAYSVFDSSYESGRVSKTWLEKAPNSAYAMTARAEFFRAMAWEARGGKFAEETPQENMGRMTEFADKGIDLYQKALKIEPRLLQAYAGMIDLALADSRSDIAQSAWEHGKAIDPACKTLSGYRMTSLEPRWGGSYPEMLKLVKELTPFLTQRPLLALNTIWPMEDLGDVLWRDDKQEEAIKVLEPVLPLTTHPDPYEDVGLLISFRDKNNNADEWKGLMYLVAATRFKSGRAQISRERGRELLLLARDPDWANASLKQSVYYDPDNAYGHYLLAASFWNSGRSAEAEADYVVAMKDADNRRDSLYEVTGAMLDAHFNEKARAYVEMLNQEYPDFAKGWWRRADVLSTLHADGVVPALEKFLSLADSNDVKLNSLRESAQSELEQIRVDKQRKGLK